MHFQRKGQMHDNQVDVLNDRMWAFKENVRELIEDLQGVLKRADAHKPCDEYFIDRAVIAEMKIEFLGSMYNYTDDIIGAFDSLIEIIDRGKA